MEEHYTWIFVFYMRFKLIINIFTNNSSKRSVDLGHKFYL